MPHSAQFSAFLSAALALAIATWSIQSSKRGLGWLTAGLSSAILFTPLLISSQHVMTRALACVLAIEVFFKTIDYARHRSTRSDCDESFLAFAKFLIPFPVLLVRFSPQTRHSQTALSSWRPTVFALISFGLCFVMLERLWHAPMLRSSFLLDHTIKFLIFTVAIESLACLLNGLERLAGFEVPPLIDSAYRSQTVGEFWRRYNTRVHAWLIHNIFRPMGGRRRPVRAILLTFFVSAILHEIGFAIATSRCDGYQFMFFLLQAPAVIFGHLVQRVATRSTVGKFALHITTILWMWASSMLFFHGVDRVFPAFYASDPWLP